MFLNNPLSVGHVGETESVSYLYLCAQRGQYSSIVRFPRHLPMEADTEKTENICRTS